MANRLTPKEEIFCMAIVEGKTQYEAYCTAYNTKTDRRNTVDSNAWKVLAKPHIQERIAELKQKKDDRKMFIDILDMNKRYALLNEQIEVARQNNDHAAIARYMDIINKMTGAYVNITKDISDNKPLEKLSEDDLKALIAGNG